MAAQRLNPAQQAAVDHGDGPILVLAGAGSGKTRVITHRLATLVGRRVRPWRILAVTFTNKAAGEMRKRAAELLGPDAGKIWIGTFHATCARLLRLHAQAAGLRPDFLIYDDSDQKSLLLRVMKDLGIHERTKPRDLLSAISRAKDEGVGAADYRGHDFLSDLVARVYPEYQRRLRAANAVDFGDLILDVLQLCHHPAVGADLASRFDHVLVDEFQDTNVVQYQLVDHLARRTGNLCVVGDDDQSIYGWRGAVVDNILDFDRHHGGCAVVKLEQNYRSTQTILDAANAVIARNRGRKPKRLFTESGAGEAILYFTALDEREEAGFVAQAVARLGVSEGRALGDFAVFYRTHAQSRQLEEAFRKAAIGYRIVGGTRFFDRAEIKDLLAYLRVIQNPDDEVSLERIINVPARGIGEATVEKVASLGRGAGVSLWAALKLALHPAAPLFTDGAAAPAADLGAGPRKRLTAFVQLLEELRAEATTAPLPALAEAILERTGYLESLSLDPSPEARDRLENVGELVASLKDYEAEAEEPSLVGYLERVALVAATDASADGAVALMTVHAAKGLEFPVVFVTGLEEGTFPRLDPDGDDDDLEEERRLAYVAITRARERLVLTNAAHRRLFGRDQRVVGGRTAPLDPVDPYALRESRFLGDIPDHCIARPVARRRPTPPPTGLRRTARGPTVIERDDGLVIERDDAPVSSLGARRGPPPSDERRIEYDEGPSFRVGQRVRHSRCHDQFGEGKVTAVTGGGADLKLVIHFSKAGPKTVLARFVEPA